MIPSDNKAFLQTPQDVSIPREDEHLTDAEYVELEEEIYATETESVPKPVLESEPESSQRGPDSPVISRSL